MARVKKLFSKDSTEPFELSRSKIELFMNCPRCLYLDVRLGVKQPPSFPFTLNNAVDALFKKEFDHYREQKKIHPLIERAGLSLIPYQHAELDIWRDPFKGIRYTEPESNITVTGGVDDIWTDGEQLYIVDYKATSKDTEVNLDSLWQKAYKNQVEIYQWLFQKNGFNVHPTAYFVYTNASKSEPNFNDTLVFSTRLLPHTGKTDWIPDVLKKIKETLSADEIPAIGIKDDEEWNYATRRKERIQKPCDFCMYRENAGKAFKAHLAK